MLSAVLCEAGAFLAQLRSSVSAFNEAGRRPAEVREAMAACIVFARAIPDRDRWKPDMKMTACDYHIEHARTHKSARLKRLVVYVIEQAAPGNRCI